MQLCKLFFQSRYKRMSGLGYFHLIWFVWTIIGFDNLAWISIYSNKNKKINFLIKLHQKLDTGYVRKVFPKKISGKISRLSAKPIWQSHFFEQLKTNILILNSIRWNISLEISRTKYLWKTFLFQMWKKEQIYKMLMWEMIIKR